MTAGINTVIGGADADIITAQDGRNTILGDEGQADFFTDSTLQQIESLNFDMGGSDTINLNNGVNAVIGGAVGDTITAQDGDNTILGDNGRAEFLADGTLQRVKSVGALGGSDTITVGLGQSRVIGGVDVDQITIGAGDNVVLGDNGVAEFEASGNLINISTIDAGAGAGDTIASGAGYNVIFGGDADDSIQAGIDSTTDIVVGDNGSAVFESGICGNLNERSEYWWY